MDFSDTNPDTQESIRVPSHGKKHGRLNRCPTKANSKGTCHSSEMDLKLRSRSLSLKLRRGSEVEFGAVKVLSFRV